MMITCLVIILICIILIYSLFLLFSRGKEQYLSNFEIRESGIHGKGVFTNHAIGKGETLFNAFPGMHPSRRNDPVSVAAFKRMASVYIPYINHCKRKRNVKLVDSNDKINLISVRDIASGEEVVADYDSANHDFPFIAPVGENYVEC
jgi:hypothetical protein